MFRWRRLLIVIVLLAGLAACSDKGGTATPSSVVPPPPTAAATPTPAIRIVTRDQVLIGADSAYPPFVDLDPKGRLVGLEVDLLAALAEAVGLDYRLVEVGWETIFDDLIAGKIDAVVGGVTEGNAPADLVELSKPYLEVGEVAAVLSSNEEILTPDDLRRATVGVQPRSWGEFAVSGEAAVVPVPAGSLRYYDTAAELVEALLDGHVDAIVTHHTVVDSYASANPGDLRLVGGEGRDAWLVPHRYHIAVPKGADALLARLNQGIQALISEGTLAELERGWGLAPEFAQRPRFAQDVTAASLIAGIEKVDEMTVRLVLNRPDPNLDYKLAVPAMAIHSPLNLERLGGGGDLGLNPVGSGPYVLAGWAPGQAITLTANPTYWGEPAKMPMVIVRPVREAAERFALLEAGQVQLAENLAAESLTELEEEENDKVVVAWRDPVNIAFLGMNRDLAPFDDRRVRQAIADCIDQADLVETVYPTGTLIAYQFVPPNTFGFTPGLLWYENDPEGAAALLAESGFAEGLSLTLSLSNVPSDFLPDPSRIAAAIQEQLAGCQISATLDYLDPDTFADRLVAGELPFHLGGWSPDLPGPLGFLNYHFAGEANGRQFGAPFPAIVERLQAAARVSDRTQRQGLYNEVNELLKDKIVFVPLAHGGATLAASADLPGVVANPVRRESLATFGPITGTAEITRLVFAVSSEPLSLDPSDEVDDASFWMAMQIFDTLVAFEPATTILTASLAIEWSANETFDVWEFKLRPGVVFQDGAPLNADAVILNLERLWDAGHPLHQGRSGAFRYFVALWGGFKQN